MAYNLLEAGLAPGDLVLLMLPNIAEFVITYYALQKAGLVMVLLTVNHTAREIIHLAQLTEPKGWVVPDRYRKTDYAPWSRRCAPPTLAQGDQVADQKPAGDVLGTRSCRRGTADDANVRAALEAARPDPGDVCQILPSGGTTGLPKGARGRTTTTCATSSTSRRPGTQRHDTLWWPPPWATTWPCWWASPRPSSTAARW